MFLRNEIILKKRHVKQITFYIKKTWNGMNPFIPEK
jgi:hypothetical protein